MSSTRADQEIGDVWLGCVYAWLCTSATVEGLARGRTCWAAGQIGESAHPGQRLSARRSSTGDRHVWPSVVETVGRAPHGVPLMGLPLVPMTVSWPADTKLFVRGTTAPP
jgi:hypothetical protein